MFEFSYAGARKEISVTTAITLKTRNNATHARLTSVCARGPTVIPHVMQKVKIPLVK